MPRKVPRTTTTQEDIAERRSPYTRRTPTTPGRKRIPGQKVPAEPTTPRGKGRPLPPNKKVPGKKLPELQEKSPRRRRSVARVGRKVGVGDGIGRAIRKGVEPTRDEMLEMLRR